MKNSRNELTKFDVVFLKSEIRLEPSMTRFAADVCGSYCMLLLHVQSICFHSFEHFFTLLTGLFEDSFLFHGSLGRMFLSHVQLESFFAVENFFTFFALSPSDSSEHDSLGVVVRQVVFFQIVVAFGSVGTKRAKEAGLSHVRVYV